MQIEKEMSDSLYGQCQANVLVCPSHLCKGLFTEGAMDNENQKTPPSLSDFGKIRIGRK